MNRPDQNLKDAISANERRALWCAGAVVFGLVLEVIFAAAFHERPETGLSHWGPVIADVIVASGVAGEVLFGRKSRIDSEELTRRSEERLAEANSRAAEAEQKAAEAQLQLERLREELLPRIIPDIFLNGITDITPPEIVKVWFSGDALDGLQVAWQLELLLKAARWPVSLEGILPRNDPRSTPSVETFESRQSRVLVMGPWPSPAFQISPSFTGLRDAVISALGSTTGLLQKDVPQGELWVIIRPKLPAAAPAE